MSHRVVMFPSNNKALKAWRASVEAQARAQMPAWLRKPWDGAVYLAIVYVRERPASDYLSDGTSLAKGARRYPSTKPDIDKLDRAMLDALTDVAFTDDGRVVTCVSTKRFGAPGERAHVLVDVGLLR